jgi:hypothetical protein
MRRAIPAWMGLPVSPDLLLLEFQAVIHKSRVGNLMNLGLGFA